MRQAIMTAPGRIEFREVPPPTAGPGEVLLRIVRIGVCGSDVHVNHGRHPFTSYPVVQGHEYSGVIEGVGPGVSGPRIGMKATGMPQVVCGQCPPCRRGDYHICDHLKVQGFQAPGCAQDLFAIKASSSILLPDSFTPEQGALVEPVAVAAHAARRAGDLSGKNVAVLGAGPIGNLVAQVALGAGGHTLIADVSGYRLEVAQRCGVGLASNAREESIQQAAQRAFNGEAIGVIFDCAGTQASISAAIDAVGKGGMIVVVAVFGEQPRVNLAVIQDRELELRGTLMYKRHDYERAVELIAGGTVVTGPLESKHFAFADYAEAYAYIDREGDKCVKVFIDL